MTAVTPGGDAGPRVLVITHEAHAGLGRLGDLGGCVVDERRPDLGDPLPQEVTDHDALVVLGGSMACWEDEAAPWLPRTRRLLAAAVERRVPTLGICLGAQLLAAATGGRVARGAAGLEVGLTEVALTPAAEQDPFFRTVSGTLGPTFSAAQWHQDAITDLPPGAALLATGSRYPHQAFRVGDTAWGVQYHPEVSTTDWDDWLTGYHGVVHPEGLDVEAVAGPVRAAQEHLAAVAAAHAAAFRAVLDGPRERSSPP